MGWALLGTCAGALGGAGSTRDVRRGAGRAALGTCAPPCYAVPSARDVRPPGLASEQGRTRAGRSHEGAALIAQ